MPNLFDLSRTYDDTTNSPTPEYTAKQNDNGIQGVISAGPISDPQTVVACLIQIDKTGVGGANGAWSNEGGLSGTGGLVSTTKGGPANTPVTITAQTFCALQQGWKVRALVTVQNAPVAGVPISFTGAIF